MDLTVFCIKILSEPSRILKQNWIIRVHSSCRSSQLCVEARHSLHFSEREAGTRQSRRDARSGSAAHPSRGEQGSALISRSSARLAWLQSPPQLWDPPSVQAGLQLRKFVRLRAQQGSEPIPDFSTLWSSELFRFTSLSFIMSLSQTRGWQIWIKGFRDQL